MKCLVTTIVLFLAPTLLSAQTTQRPLLLESGVTVKGIERVVHKNGVVRLATQKFTSIIPNELAELVSEQTGIKCGDVGACATVLDKGSAFGRVTVLGDGFSRKGKSKIDGVESEHDYSYTFKPCFETGNESSFVTEGAFLFRNNLLGAECYVVCRITGNRTEAGRLSGDAEWIGPLKRKAAKNLALIFEQGKPDTK